MGAIAGTLSTIPTDAPLSTIRVKYVGFLTSPNFTLEDPEAWDKWQQLRSASQWRSKLVQDSSARNSMQVVVEITRCDGMTDEGLK